MTYSWVYINRNAALTRLVIPGWSILPRYFATLFPDDNLIVLNPFILDEQQLLTYCEQEFGDEHIQVVNQTVGEAMTDLIDRVFIFSMGLQWVYEHAPQLLDMPCDIASPAVSYNSNDLDPMIRHLKTAKEAVLRSFYRRCFHSNDDWLNWKQQIFESHVIYNDADILIGWLDHYGRIDVEIPNVNNITLWLDPTDKIGEKPVIPATNMKMAINIHSNGHILSPQ
tara:strand:+ start:91 stop:765 length:675 start_codon:yes stop_codon:yes gene_type:complete